MREIPPPVFSRRSFLVFILLAPACVIAVAAIVLTLQYKQFRTLVSETSTLAALDPAPETRVRSEVLLQDIKSFSDGTGSDTLALTPEDLNTLTAVSPVLKREEIRIHLSAADSLLVVETSRRLDALNGRFAWIFKRITPVKDGWLNARMAGYPVWSAGKLDFSPEKGYLNETKVPKAAMTKRGGMSPRDFLDTSAALPYQAFLGVLDTVLWNGNEVLLVRSPKDP